MADLDQIKINGNVYSWGSNVIKVGGKRLRGIKGIEYGQKRTRVKAYGSAGHQGALGRTRGKSEVDNAKLTLFLHTAEALRAELAALSESGTSYGDEEFQVTIEASEKWLPSMLIELNGCVWETETGKFEEGSDPSLVDIEVNVMVVRVNGRTLANEDTDRL